ncbi:MAG: alpha-galactosidase [Spirochaetaceae bacterium]|jgi:alpha-galactosidase|nr:alpha-galactosidase [Spirochaetaceae bacterium]
MPIRYDHETREFHLYNDSFSYIIKVLDNGYIGQVYCGVSLNPERTYPLLSPVPFCGFLNNPRSAPRFEYPLYGGGDYKYPAFTAVLENGSSALEPEYTAYQISIGKPGIPGLPSTYIEDEEEACTLEIELFDALSGVQIILYYSIFTSFNCLARHTRIINGGNRRVTLKNVMSLNLDLPDSDWNLVTLTGAGGREFQVAEHPLIPGIREVGSLRGISGYGQNPFLLLKRPHADEFQGEAVGFSLLYSGNFLASAEVDSYNLTRIRMGINPETFSWELPPKGIFDTPEVIMAYSAGGINRLSQEYHRLYRTRLVWGGWRDRERPVLLNGWEGTEGGFTEKKLLEAAGVAGELGIELFVLGNGWFGSGDEDAASRGDRVPGTRKLLQGISALAQAITGKGLKFGLCIEPDTAGLTGRLFETHPDWAVGLPDRPGAGEGQRYVPDMSRKEVVDHLFSVLSELMASAPISYIKWDMNRSITGPWSPSLPPHRQGEFFHRYCLGVYDLYARLTNAFPQILFEPCAGGGGCFDPGFLSFAPQGWLSDDTGALERLTIQAGASLYYPLGALGAPVSAAPGHRGQSPLAFRSMTAFFGALGFELDPTQLSPKEKKEIAEHIAFYKAHRSLFHQGRFSRLRRPGGSSCAAWMVTSGDQGIVGVYKCLSPVHPKPLVLRLTGLDPSAVYEVSVWEAGGFDPGDREGNCGLRGGDELMRGGLLLNSPGLDHKNPGDFFSELFLLRRQPPSAGTADRVTAAEGEVRG